MPASVNLAKAELQEIDLSNPSAEPMLKIPVQFNPETLKVSFSNQFKSPKKSNGGAQQFVGEETTKLSLQLWFDVTVLNDLDKIAGLFEEEERPLKDVRKLTQKIIYFITPVDRNKNNLFLPPGVRFIWGSFQFEGVMESLEESLDFFSSEGLPLRSTITINLTRKTEHPVPEDDGKKTPGKKPLTIARKGENFAEMAAKQGKGADWQSIAAANGIENPRQIPAGQHIDMEAVDAVSGGAPLINDRGAPVVFVGGEPFELE